MTDLPTDEVSLLALWNSWSEEGKAQAAALLQQVQETTWKPFYCGNWQCDGRPHGEWAWPHGRGDQHPPRTNWDIWIELSGRGAGKTRSGAEWTHRVTDKVGRIALVSPTATDCRDILVEGESGLLATQSPRNPCTYLPSKRRVEWANGAVATMFSAEKADRLRGPQHGAAWVDEACVAEGTPVLLRRGWTPIEDVRPGDEAWTRRGWRRVTAARQTGVRDTLLVRAGGRVVEATEDHLFATTDGWTRCDSLHGATIMLACSPTGRPHGSSGEDAATTASAAATTPTAGAVCSTAMSGSPSTGRSRTATRSTTTTRTKRTTIRATSSSSPSPSTPPSLSEPWPLGASIPSSRERLLSGRSEPANARPRSGLRLSPRSGPAPCAAAPSRARAPEPATAPSPVVLAPVESVTPSRRLPVYDLTVDEAHEFVAGGFVVHNCFMANIDEVWDNLLFGMRLGSHPRVHITTTPMPRRWLKRLLKQDNVHLTTASTYANIDNLAPQFRKAVLDKYEGTRLGRQEIHAEVLDDIEGALWSLGMIDTDRVVRAPEELKRIIVSVDPAGSSRPGADETGIVVVGQGEDEHGYILADLSGVYSPDEWAKKALHAYRTFDADAIVAETNYGGEMVTNTIRLQPDALTVPIFTVVARRGKRLRAEPVVALYEQHRVHHVGVLMELETQMTEWVPDETKDSPDRLDALVHGLTLMLVKQMPGRVHNPAQIVRRVNGLAPVIPLRRPA